MSEKAGSSLSKLAGHAMNSGKFKDQVNRIVQPGPSAHQIDHQEFLQNKFNLSEMEHELHQIQGPPSWAQEFHQAPPEMLERDQFMEFEQIYNRQPPPEWAQQFEQFTHSHQQFDPEWEQAFQKYQAPDKGKAPMTDQDWTLEFERQSKLLNAATEANDTNWEQEFQEVWKQMQENPDNQMLDEDWAKQFKDLYPNQFDEPHEVDPVFAECAPYEFEKENEFLSHPDPFQQGMELLNAQGSLSLAALAFEAAVQRDPKSERAWMMLGRVQAENEKEVPAIAALQRCVQENPQNKEALMMLAVSYTNEGQISESLATLDRWLRTTFPELKMSPIKPGEDVHSRLSQYYLEAVARDAASNTINADLQIGLGLLFYNVGDYEKTIDCFTAALQLAPDNYLLWNKLGATLSNSGNNESAIEAYHKALELKPNFVRGRYNLGVSCMNIGCYREAAEHYLTALSQHVVNEKHQVHVSSTLWDTLKRNFMLMERRDLVELAKAGDVEVFRKEFEF